MKKTILLTVFMGLAGCSGESREYPAAEDATVPYILKQGCKFTIISEQGSAGVSSPELSGAPGVSASMSVSLGEMSIAVSDCRVVENSHGLAIYEQ